MNLVIANRQRRRKIQSAQLKTIVVALLAELGIKEVGLEINLLGAMQMAALNETFLQHEGSTDVITFDYSVPEAGGRRVGDGLAGEIFVCVDEAIVQAKQFRTDWQAEVVRYIVHGILHLLGHDDLRADRRRAMKREENRLVAMLSRRFSLAKISGAS